MLAIFGLFAVFSPQDASAIIVAIIGAVALMCAAMVPFWQRIRGGQQQAIGIATEAAKDAKDVAKQMKPNATTTLRDAIDRIEASYGRIEARLDEQDKTLVRVDARLIDVGTRITTVEQLNRRGP